MNVSRRSFLSRGSLGLAVAGAAALIPGIGSALRQPPAPPIAIDPATITDPLVAHVRDLNKGEISLMVGDEHVVVQDVNLAGRLYGAALTPRNKAR